MWNCFRTHCILGLYIIIKKVIANIIINDLISFRKYDIIQ
jgi:hypothetical protein